MPSQPELTIVYTAYGNQRYLDQARFSILTLLYHLLRLSEERVNILVLTFHADWVPRHPRISTRLISPAEIKAMRGPCDYAFRNKMILPRQLAEVMPMPLLFVDSDTRWLSFPLTLVDRLNSRSTDGREHFCMHLLEGYFGDNFFPTYKDVTQKYESRLKGLASVQSVAPFIWNSGALGFPAKPGDFHQRVLAVADFLLPRVKPRDWIEQYAYTIVGSERYSLFPLGDALHHYWNQNFEAPYYLRELFREIDALHDVEAKAEACATVDWDDAYLCGLQSDPAIVKLRRQAKWRRSLNKRRVDMRCWLESLAKK